MATINPYLVFAGNAEEAFNFYKSVFGGEFAGNVNKFKDSPGGEKLSPSDQEKVMHVSLPIGNGFTLMASDSLEGMGHTLIVGNNISISIGAESEDEANKLFNGLSAGGKITMPLEKTFWGAYFGMFTDKFGINWMVNYDYSQQP